MHTYCTAQDLVAHAGFPFGTVSHRVIRKLQWYTLQSLACRQPLTDKHTCAHTQTHTFIYTEDSWQLRGKRQRWEERRWGALVFCSREQKDSGVGGYENSERAWLSRHSEEREVCMCLCVRPCPWTEIICWQQTKRKVSLFALGDTIRNKATWFKCRLCASVLLDAVFTMVRWRLVLGMCLLWLSLSWARRELMCCVAYSSQTGSAAVTELVWKRISPWLTRRGINLN